MRHISGFAKPKKYRPALTLAWSVIDGFRHENSFKI
jgi:hypothetical protein